MVIVDIEINVVGRCILIFISIRVGPLMQRQIGKLLNLAGASLRASYLPHTADVNNLSCTLLLNTV